MIKHKCTPFIVSGIALGYSDEGIIEYLRRRYEPGNPRISMGPGDPFYRTGYIPTLIDQQDEQEAIRLINSRRMVSTPFPKVNFDEISCDNYRALKKNPIVIARHNAVIEKLKGINLVV